MAIISGNFAEQKQSFILVWAGNERRGLSWDGEVVFIPCRDEVFDQRYRFQSAKDGDGKYIPGTVVVSDVTARDPETGLMKHIVNARTFLEQTQINSAKLFASGLIAVNDVEDIPEAMAISEKRWARTLESADLRVMQEEAQRISEHHKQGLPVPPMSEKRAVEVRDAMARQSERNRLRTGQTRVLEADLNKLLEGGSIEDKPPSVEEIMTPSLPPVTPDELFEECAALGVELSREEKAGILARDKRVMDAVAKRNEQAANEKLGEPLEPDVDTSPMMAARKKRKTA